MKLSVIILAAGQGTRMRSDIPKVLHKVGGFSMLEHVISIASSIPDNLNNVQIEDITVVVSSEVESHHEMETILGLYDGVRTVLQRYKFGTGHAVYTGLEGDSESEAVLVMYGDVPLITIESVINLIKKFDYYDLVGTAFKYKGEKPYGRFELSEEGYVKRVIEAHEIDDLNAFDLANAGMLIADREFLYNALHARCDGISVENFHGEVYLTDLFEIGKSSYIEVDPVEAVGVNNRTELAAAENLFQQRIRDRMMKKGVTLIAPETIFFAADTEINHDTVIHPYVRFGKEVEIGYGCEIKSFCDLEGVIVGNQVSIGPFARVRSSTEIGDNAKIGNFVELKNAQISSRAKASHLSYLGDVFIGQNSNIGAGTIICNYDGVNKHHTVIGSNVHIGANSSIISPRVIGDFSKVAAGSVVTDDVMDYELAIARSRQINKKRKPENPS